MVVTANALVSAAGSIRLESSRAATMHFDTNPNAISTTPGTMSTPVGSLWQEDVVSLRCIMEVSWALRDQRAVAWLEPSNW